MSRLLPYSLTSGSFFIALATFASVAILPGAAEGDAGSLTKKAAISCEKAEAIALAKYPGAIVEEIEIERDDKILHWEVELRSEGKWKIDLEIDAQSGEILKTDKHTI